MPKFFFKGVDYLYGRNIQYSLNKFAIFRILVYYLKLLIILANKGQGMVWAESGPIFVKNELTYSAFICYYNC